MSKDCYVYVVGTIRNGLMDRPVKVGITNSPNSRLKAIQTGSPDEVAFVWVFAMPNKQIARHIETCFHETQVKHRLRGEWFAIDPLIAVQLMCLNIRASLMVNLSGWSQDRIEDAYAKTRAAEAWDYVHRIVAKAEAAHV